ncbi:MAG: hypothetical protein H6513_01820 [Acidimicrobiaceae bacterium]|nr:hypothetical protein [Acidimicrobiaceae bacterium]MCO5330094.1 hypothetical protein [Ilumatobacteraceae bacterium]
MSDETSPASASVAPAVRPGELHRREIRLAAPTGEFSYEFVQGMANRMAVSYHKYGALADAYPHRMDALASIAQRLSMYAETGNTEWLMDVANYAMIEFMHPGHPVAHFEATDSDASPGRVDHHGGIHHDCY